MPYVLILLSLCFSSFFLAAAEKSAKSGGLSDSFGSYDEEYFTAKNKATEGGEIVGDWEFTDRDRKINDARRKYGEDTTRFKSAVKEIRERDFLQRSKDIVDQKISQAVPDSLRHRILLGLRRKMDEAGFLSSFCKNIATLEEEIFRTKFDRQVQQLLYEWVSRYQTVSERTKTVERNSNFVNSETEEKSLRAALEELSKNRAQRFFHSGGPLPSLGQVEDINVGFSKIVRQANAVLTALPDRRLAYRGAEANKAAQKKARLERE